MLKDIIIGRLPVLKIRKSQDTTVHALINVDSRTPGIVNEGDGISTYEVWAVSHYYSTLSPYYYVDDVYHVYVAKDPVQIEMSEKLLKKGEPVPLTDLPLYLHWPLKSKLFDNFLAQGR